MSNGMKYFLVSVEVKQGAESGKVKKHTEQYLVEAVSVTDSEARLINDFIKAGDLRDYVVKASRETQIVEVIRH